MQAKLPKQLISISNFLQRNYLLSEEVLQQSAMLKKQISNNRKRATLL
jgi:hypothetical protein